jgi:hypothetical protein
MEWMGEHVLLDRTEEMIEERQRELKALAQSVVMIVGLSVNKSRELLTR